VGSRKRGYNLPCFQFCVILSVRFKNVVVITADKEGRTIIARKKYYTRPNPSAVVALVEKLHSSKWAVLLSCFDVLLGCFSLYGNVERVSNAF